MTTTTADDHDHNHDADHDHDPGPRPAANGNLVERAWQWCRAHLADLAIVAFITLLAFPRLVRAPLSGLDPSFMAGISLARVQDLRFGPDVMFTYGPLGDVSYSFVYFSKQWFAAVAVALACRVALIALTYVLLRRVASRWICLAVLVVALPPILPTIWVLSLVGIVWALLGVTRDRSFLLAEVIGAGAFCAVVGTIKLDTAVLCVVVLAAAIIGKSLELGRVKEALIKGAQFFASAGGTLVFLWVAVGLPLGDLAPYVRGAISLTQGYASNMGIEDPKRASEYLIAFALMAWIIGGTAIAPNTAWRRRVAVAVVSALAVFILFRQGFTRHDTHATAFFVPLVFIAAALASTWGWRRAAWLGGATLVMVYVASGATVADRFDVANRVDNALDTAHLVVDGSARAEFMESGRQALRDEYAIPDTMLARMDGQTVHISPWEATIAWAYPEIVWDPLPVFQEYAAYTPYLDGLNADKVTGDDPPQFILKQSGIAIDGRLARWEGPQTNVEIACRYHQVDVSGGWQLLELGPNRCGDLAPLSTTSAAMGEAVPIPEAGDDELVVARFSGLNESLTDRFRTSALKSRNFFVTGDDGQRHRFVTDTQGQWHVVRAPACAAGILDGTPWVSDNLTFTTPSTPFGSADPVGVEFATIPFSC